MFDRLGWWGTDRLPTIRHPLASVAHGFEITEGANSYDCRCRTCGQFYCVGKAIVERTVAQLVSTRSNSGANTSGALYSHSLEHGLTSSMFSWTW